MRATSVVICGGSVVAGTLMGTLAGSPSFASGDVPTDSSDRTKIRLLIFVQRLQNLRPRSATCYLVEVRRRLLWYLSLTLGAGVPILEQLRELVLEDPSKVPCESL